MRIATWNINGLRARVEFVLHWLRIRTPDVVALQELKLEDEKFPCEVFEAEGYQALVYGQKSWNGVAVLSRNAGEVLRRGLPGEEDFGSRALVTLVDGLVFASLYCPNGKRLDHDDYWRKLHWFDSLYAFLDQEYQAADALVLGGDFNLCPSPLDSWNEEGLRGEIFHTDEERMRFQRLVGIALAGRNRRAPLVGAAGPDEGITLQHTRRPGRAKSGIGQRHHDGPRVNGNRLQGDGLRASQRPDCQVGDCLAGCLNQRERIRDRLTRRRPW